MSDSDDAILALRASIAAKATPILLSSPNFSDPKSQVHDLVQATHIYFPKSRNTLPLAADTQFKLEDKFVDLRSVYFAWLQKEASSQQYLELFQTTNEKLSEQSGATAQLQSIPFADRLDLNVWLEKQNIPAPAGLPYNNKPDFAVQSIIPDERLLAIQRDILNCTTVLHGSTQMNFSKYREYAVSYLGIQSKSSSAQNNSSAAPSSSAAASNTTTLVANQHRKPANRNQDPIILLSPSASALLRMNNVKRFLEQGIYTPATTDADASRQMLQRNMPSIEPSRPLRFLVLESVDQFKPEYWSRLVAVFTTGQSWQYKGYKWRTPQEIFARVQGIYLGTTGEALPEDVKSYGRSVKVMTVEKWNDKRGEQSRWKDREVVEAIWLAIEESMRSKGWNKN